MKICVYGAGAVGGHIAGRLAAESAEVSVIARGAQLAAIREHGLRVETRDGNTGLPSGRHRSTRRSGAPGHRHRRGQGPERCRPSPRALASLLHQDSLVLFVGNGIPWWYFHSHGGTLDGTQLPRLDPERALWDHIGPERAVGAVAYTACSVIAPGVIRAENPRNRLIIGRPDGRPDGSLDTLASLLTPAAWKSPSHRRSVTPSGPNCSMNLIGGSLGVLTASPMKDVLDKPAIAGTAKAMAAEGAAIARALGCDPGDPHEGLSKLAKSSHLQSIAQDLQAGRPMEIDAMFRVPLDLAELAQVPTPNLDLMIELATQRARAAGLYHDTST